MTGLKVLRAGPSCIIQDQGRSGFLSFGLARGGAADLDALAEGAALLGQAVDLAALEMAGVGCDLEAIGDVRIALTGAQMAASIDGDPVVWNASHTLSAGQVLSIGAARTGVYGYLHVGGGFDTPAQMGSRSVHLVAGVGGPIEAGDLLPVGKDTGRTGTGNVIKPSDRFGGGDLRVVAGFQTPLFSEATQTRFANTQFTRGPRANRMGIQMTFDGAGFTAEGQLNVLSEMIVVGDIQMTGDGRPFVLMPECQTTGGYPRIATVIPCDLPKVAQAPLGASIRFRFVSRDEALAAERAHRASITALPSAIRPLVRRVEDIGDLLSYQLISGAISATDSQDEARGEET